MSLFRRVNTDNAVTNQISNRDKNDFVLMVLRRQFFNYGIKIKSKIFLNYKNNKFICQYLGLIRLGKEVVISLSINGADTSIGIDQDIIDLIYEAALNNANFNINNANILLKIKKLSDNPNDFGLLYDETSLSPKSYLINNSKITY